MSRIAIFIDGAYLDYYYHCRPYKSNSPTIEESQRFSQAQGFYRRLQRLSRFEVREGKLEFRGRDGAGSPIFVQKRVDIQIGVDLVLLSAKHQVTHAALVSGDSDLLPAVYVAKAEGVLMHLHHGTATPPHTASGKRQTSEPPLPKR